MEDRFHARSLGECFTFDASALNPVPMGLARKIIALIISPRYSMTTLMRITQYTFLLSEKSSQPMKGMLHYGVAFLKRLNSILHNFEHGSNPSIAAGIVLHHTGVCITGKTVIEEGVHIYRNVTFGGKDGGAPYVKKGAKIGSHAVVLGRVVIGERAIVAPGAVVVKDVPDGKIAAGVPARIIGDVTDDRYSF